MKKRVLVVCKRSFLESHGEGLGRLPAATRRRADRAHAENLRTLHEVTAHLARRGVAADAVYRGSVAARRKYDLVIALGGDGTIFAASRYLHGTPLLGINSDPANSLGLWTCADRRDFRGPLDLALAGRLAAVPIARMRIAINGKTLPEQAFNDVLVAHRNPSAMSRYRVAAGGRAEIHRSSGVWVSTAAGSTAGIRSAGGRRMPISSRRLQYRVREPYGWPGGRRRLLHGIVPRLTIRALGVGLALWIDGDRVRYDLALGDRVDLRIGDPLPVLGYNDARRRRLFP